jgi:hypothetical protein
MLAVPAPRIELPTGVDAACADDAAAARLCRALLDKARELKHSGDGALRLAASSSSAPSTAGAEGAPGAVTVWDGRALSFYVCAAVTYIECAELVHRLGRLLAEQQEAAPTPAGASSPSPPPPSSSQQQQQQQQRSGELARLAAQLRPQLMAQTATLCHAAAAGARQRLARLTAGDGGGGGGDGGSDQASRRQYALYAALCERLAAVCHLRHVAAQALVLKADVRLCAAATAGTTGGGGGGGSSTPPPPPSSGGPPSSQHRLADAAQHTLRALDLVASSSRALRSASADEKTRECAFASAAVAHVAFVGLDLGLAAPGGGGSSGDVFRLAARARAALACIKSMGGGGGPGRR